MKKLSLTAAVLAGALSAGMAFTAFAASINIDQAKAIAYNHAGVSSDDVLHVKTDIDYENRTQIFEVKFTEKGFKEYDYEISAADGSVIKYEYDAEIYNLNNGLTKFAERGKTNFATTAEQAKNTALAHAGIDASDVTFINAHLDYDDGIYAYEGKFYYGNYEYEFEVDADSGAIIKFEMDHVYY